MQLIPASLSLRVFIVFLVNNLVPIRNVGVSLPGFRVIDHV